MPLHCFMVWHHSDPGLLSEWSQVTYRVSYTNINFHRRKRSGFPPEPTLRLPSLPYWGGWYKRSWEDGGGRRFSNFNHLFKWHCHTKCPVPWKFELKRCLIELGVVVLWFHIIAFVLCTSQSKITSFHSLKASSGALNSIIISTSFQICLPSLS